MDTNALLATCRNVLPGHSSNLTIKERLLAIAGNLQGDERHDSYGTGDYLQAFEQQVADMFGKEAAVFMPSGTMAQQIAMRVWCDRSGRQVIAMHPTSHLEFAEHLGYQFLQGLRRLQFAAPEFLGDRMLTVADFEALGQQPGAALLELPYRPLGGQLPTWGALEAIRDWSAAHQVPLHLDGARIWQCRPFYNKSYPEIAGLFDSLYVSFYKDLGGLAGCMLLGPTDFIKESRVWMRRYGGNLYTQAPFYVAARQGMEHTLPLIDGWVTRAGDVAAVLTRFRQIRINPDPPQVNFFRMFIEGDAEALTNRHHELAKQTGTFLFHRLNPANVPGWATTEMHMFDNAAAFDLSQLHPFVARLLDESLP